MAYFTVKGAGNFKEINYFVGFNENYLYKMQLIIIIQVTAAEFTVFFAGNGKSYPDLPCQAGLVSQHTEQQASEHAQSLPTCRQVHHRRV